MPDEQVQGEPVQDEVVAPEAEVVDEVESVDEEVESDLLPDEDELDATPSTDDVE